jgi:hypothetical protein
MHNLMRSVTLERNRKMFDKYWVVYRDYVAARKTNKVQLQPWGRTFWSLEKAKATTRWDQDGHQTDVLWPRHHHDGEDVAAPPVVWAETPFGGAVGVQWWSKDRNCGWIIIKRKFFGFERLPKNEMAWRSEYLGNMAMEMYNKIELSKAHDGNKDQIRARHDVEKHEYKIFMAGFKFFCSIG